MSMNIKRVINEMDEMIQKLDSKLKENKQKEQTLTDLMRKNKALEAKLASMEEDFHEHLQILYRMVEAAIQKDVNIHIRNSDIKELFLTPEK